VSDRAVGAARGAPATRVTLRARWRARSGTAASASAPDDLEAPLQAMLEEAEVHRFWTKEDVEVELEEVAHGYELEDAERSW
jgi:hypothetical protein